VVTPERPPTASGMRPRVEVNSAPVNSPLSRFLLRSVMPSSSSSNNRLIRYPLVQKRKPRYYCLLAVAAEVDHFNEYLAMLLTKELKIIFLDSATFCGLPLSTPRKAPSSPTEC
jgi:hypothetical protein